MLAKEKKEEIDNEFAKVFGADFVQKVNELPDDEVMESLEEIKKKITKIDCRWCNTKLDLDNIEMYPHEGGWTVKGMKEKQWLYIPCSKCHYEWALWKLGVPRE